MSLPDHLPPESPGDERDLANRAMRPRECGYRCAAGPWGDLGKGRWSVPACSEMQHLAAPDVVLERAGREFKVIKTREVERRPASTSIHE